MTELFNKYLTSVDQDIIWFIMEHFDEASFDDLVDLDDLLRDTVRSDDTDDKLDNLDSYAGIFSSPQMQTAFKIYLKHVKFPELVQLIEAFAPPHQLHQGYALLFRQAVRQADYSYLEYLIQRDNLMDQMDFAFQDTIKNLFTILSI